MVLTGLVGVCALVGLASWTLSAGTARGARRDLGLAAFGPPRDGERLLHWTVGKRVVALEKLRTIDVPAGPEALVALPDGRVVVTCRLAQAIAIIDPRPGGAIREFPFEGRPLACCVTREGTRVWVTLEDRERVVVLDIESLKRVAESRTGESPAAIAADPSGRIVAVSNGISHSITLLDARKAEPLATVEVPASPRGAVAHPVKPFLTVALTDSDRLLKVNWEKARIEDEWMVGQGPRHVVQTRDGDTLYVSLTDPPAIAKVDRLGGRVRSTCRLSRGRAGTILLGPNERDLFVTNVAGGTVTVIDTAVMREVLTVGSSPSPDGLTLSPDGRSLYVAYRNVSVVDEFRVRYAWEPVDAASEERPWAMEE